MALTKQEAEEKYIKMLYIILTRCEARIDSLLVDSFGDIMSKEEMHLTEQEVFGYRSADQRVIHIPAVATLIENKYSDWQVRYDEKDGIFTFKYNTKNQSLLNLFNSMEERFSKLDIRNDEEEEELYDDHVSYNEDDVDNDDIPF